MTVDTRWQQPQADTKSGWQPTPDKTRWRQTVDDKKLPTCAPNFKMSTFSAFPRFFTNISVRFLLATSLGVESFHHKFLSHIFIIQVCYNAHLHFEYWISNWKYSIFNWKYSIFKWKYWGVGGGLRVRRTDTRLKVLLDFFSNGPSTTIHYCSITIQPITIPKLPLLLTLHNQSVHKRTQPISL